jgi:hypothetical protein
MRSDFTKKRNIASLPDGIFEIMRTKLIGKLSDIDSEKIRNIVMHFCRSKAIHLTIKKENKR